MKEVKAELIEIEACNELLTNATDRPVDYSEPADDKKNKVDAVKALKELWKHLDDLDLKDAKKTKIQNLPNSNLKIRNGYRL